MINELTSKGILVFAAFAWCLWIFVAPRLMRLPTTTSFKKPMKAKPKTSSYRKMGESKEES